MATRRDDQVLDFLHEGVGLSVNIHLFYIKQVGFLGECHFLDTNEESVLD